MTEADPALIETANDFAAEVADLLHQTVVDDPPVGAQVVGDRVVCGRSADFDTPQSRAPGGHFRAPTTIPTTRSGLARRGVALSDLSGRPSSLTSTTSPVTRTRAATKGTRSAGVLTVHRGGDHRAVAAGPLRLVKGAIGSRHGLGW